MSKETIWHFTCKDCKNWWSYASEEDWSPSRRMWCPHCGWKHSSIEMYNQGKEPLFSEEKKAKGIIKLEIKTKEDRRRNTTEHPGYLKPLVDCERFGAKDDRFDNWAGWGND